LAGLEASEAEPEGSDQDLIVQLHQMVEQGMQAMSAPAPVASASLADRAAMEHGTQTYQVLERQLRPGEVSLDDLERAFRETAAEVAPPPAPKPAPPKEAKPVSKKTFLEPEAADSDRVANQSIRVNVDTLEHLMTMVSELFWRAISFWRSAGATRTPSSRCRCSGCPMSPPNCRKAS